MPRTKSTSVIQSIRSIGNSQGVLFPKTLLEESGLSGQVVLTVKGNTIIISPAESLQKRKTWDDFKPVPRPVTLEAPIENSFDNTEWTW